MIEIKTLEIAGFNATLQALRLPFGKECRSECNCDIVEVAPSQTQNYGIIIHSECKFDPKDLRLMSALVKRGDEHAKAIRGIMVYAEIDAPRFWWQEMDTYRVGTDRLSSESTMHIQGKGLTTEELIKMKSELTEGTMQKRVQAFSYQALRRIYIQRINHRLPHWHKFCEWIEGLPYAKEFIIGENYE